MNTLTYSVFKSDMEGALNNVIKTHEPVVVKKDRKSSVVVMPLGEYQSFVETRYLLSNPVNAARIMQGIEEVEALISQGS